MAEFFAFLGVPILIAVWAYILYLATRLVRAVERIEEKLRVE